MIETKEGSGHLQIGQEQTPVSYKLSAGSIPDEPNTVIVSLHAPRDWLLQKGFSERAELILENGEVVTVSSEKPVTVADVAAIPLEFTDTSCDSHDAIVKKYPEFSEV